MSMIRAKNTKPETALRKMIYLAGARGYRLHAALPGKPDIYFPKKRIAVFVDGCFWHGCPYCKLNPVTNRSFWKNKITANRARDRKNTRRLRRNKIHVIRIREHQLKRYPDKYTAKIISILKER